MQGLSCPLRTTIAIVVLTVIFRLRMGQFPAAESWCRKALRHSLQRLQVMRGGLPVCASKSNHHQG
ncbi:hypothetical protein [Flavisolibacter nicotianae]|uniref:hypothetical protein n=1 Tax=Flavisolibacter nicotianae TaxID=2364882 RepID=UPI0013C41D88|nr:hypothetical protein [Flavisolibacter nicotianae]